MSNAKFMATVLAGAICLTTTTITYAQYIGPGAQKTVESVADILKNPIDNQPAVLRGYLLKQVASEKYVFSDGTGEIQVDIDLEDFRGAVVDEKTHVELIGEVDKELVGSAEVDVKVLNVLAK